jgi:hypothetical protein
MQRPEYRESKYQNQGYRPCRLFMLRGGIYGRSPQYPWRALRTRRIFRRVIRLNFEHRGERWRQRSANALAFNQSDMVPVFAYQWRPKRVTPAARPPAKTQPASRNDEPTSFRRAA